MKFLGGVKRAAAIRPVRSAMTVSSWAPTMSVVTSLFGARPFFCSIICIIRSLEPPRDEMPTIFPFSSWTDLICGWDTNSNMRLGRRNKHELDRKTSHRRGNRRAGSRSIVHGAAQKRLHSHGATNENRFDIEAFFTPETFELSDFEGQLGNGNPGGGKSNFFQLRRQRRRTIVKKRTTRKGIYLFAYRLLSDRTSHSRRDFHSPTQFWIPPEIVSQIAQKSGCHPRTNVKDLRIFSAALVMT